MSPARPAKCSRTQRNAQTLRSRSSIIYLVCKANLLSKTNGCHSSARTPAGHLPDVLRNIKVNKSLKGILFDVDGTLTHSDDLHYKAFVDMLQEQRFQGLPPDTHVQDCLGSK